MFPILPTFQTPSVPLLVIVNNYLETQKPEARDHLEHSKFAHLPVQPIVSGHFVAITHMVKSYIPDNLHSGQYDLEAQHNPHYDIDESWPLCDVTSCQAI